MTHTINPLLGNRLIPVDIVLMPEWWHKNEGMCFDPDFFYHPLKRVESEQKKERVLYERWGAYGLGNQKDVARPEIGAVHLPDTFLNIRLSPVELASQSNEEIRSTITRLVQDSGNPYLTGVCCINIDDKVGDDKIDTIFETVEELRKESLSAISTK